MTSESTLRDISGGKALFDWFGRVPHFHDAEVLEITLSNKGPSTLRVHTWEITDKVNAQGYFFLDKHVVVTITLEEVTQVALDDFNLPGIIGFLEIMKIEGGYRFTWDASYGVTGSLQAKQARFDLAPGKPSGSSSAIA
jgi:hypothetical protein